MKQCVKVYELVTDKNKDVKKVLLGIYKNMGVAAKAYKAHATIVSRICHGKTKWVVIDGKTYIFKFTDKLFNKTI
jgi:hypothetical protein